MRHTGSFALVSSASLTVAAADSKVVPATPELQGLQVDTSSHGGPSRDWWARWGGVLQAELRPGKPPDASWAAHVGPGVPDREPPPACAT